MRKPIKRVDYAKTFLKQLKKAPIEIKEAFRDRFEMFLKDEFHPLLHNHQLTAQFRSYRSINITGDWRALYSQYESNDRIIIVFEMLGTHSQRYK